VTEMIVVPMDFSLALEHLKGGDKIARRSWIGSNCLWYDEKTNTIRWNVDSKLFYLTSQGDILADDWQVVKP